MVTPSLFQVLNPLVFNTVEARAEELGGSALMLTEWGQCWPDVNHPDYSGEIIKQDAVFRGSDCIDSGFNALTAL